MKPIILPDLQDRYQPCFVEIFFYLLFVVQKLKYWKMLQELNVKKNNSSGTSCSALKCITFIFSTKGSMRVSRNVN